MLKACKYLFALGLTCLVIWMSSAQSRQQLQNQIEKNKKDISVTKIILRQTRDKKVASLKLLNVYQHQIEKRKALITGINREVNSLNVEIDIARDEISAITRELESMKTEFSELIIDGYKAQKNNSKILFVFSSGNFNQLMKRLNYLRKLLEYRKLQLELIQKKQEENSVKVNALINKKNVKLSLLANRESEQNGLISDQNKEEQLIYQLKEKESELVVDLRNKQAQAKQLDNLIKELIKEENNSQVNTDDGENRETKTLSIEFESNIKSLPWPVVNGYISERFGMHKHSELKNITTENNGVNITAPGGSGVFPVYPGSVVAIMEVPGMKQSILLKHGDYYSVYANLEQVFVERGDVLKITDRIGKIVQNNDGFAELHLEIWKGSIKLNPEIWLVRK